MSELITLTCPSCGGKIKVTSNATRFVCEYCGTESVVPGTLIAAASADQKRPEIAQPANVIVDQEMGMLKLERRWFSFKYIPVAFFCVAWDAFLFFWYGIAFSTGAPWIMIVFPVAHVAVGVGLTYSTLAGFINTTVLEINYQELTIKHGPLPWLGNVKIPIHDLKQLYTKPRVTSGENGSSTTYELYANTWNGRSMKLLSGLDSADVGLFIEQQVEGWLGIDDQPVPGELLR
ncbi:MAG TPA: hypothetical protein VMC62_10585 [Longilinea sp.]|nr:hypothetical protein [Longilinea sp.]